MAFEMSTDNARTPECSLICFFCNDDRVIYCVGVNNDADEMRNALIRQRIGTHSTTTTTTTVTIIVSVVVPIVTVIVVVPVVALTQCLGMVVHCFGEGLDVCLERVFDTGVGAGTSWADGGGTEGGHHLTTGGVGH